jgi:hypothetical protein
MHLNNLQHRLLRILKANNLRYSLRIIHNNKINRIKDKIHCNLNRNLKKKKAVNAEIIQLYIIIFNNKNYIYI